MEIDPGSDHGVHDRALDHAGPGRVRHRARLAAVRGADDRALGGLRPWKTSATIEGRWRITLPFGLIHGFGFASALANLELARAKIPMALFTFNLGVEIGQLAVLALVLPILFVLRKSTLFQKWGVRGISAAIALAGAIWFVMRVVS